MVGEEIPIEHEYYLINMEIEQGNETNDDVNEDWLIEYDKQHMRYSYITEEDELNKYEKTTIDEEVGTGSLMTLKV